jgi:very-short-patch-repair endonuclease
MGGTRTASSWLDKLFGPKLLVRSKRFPTQIETETLRHLETLFPQLRIHAQVAMSALIAPARALSPKERLWTHRRYGQKVVDFVLQDRMTGQVLVLVELDDWTHNWAKDHARDRITSAGGYQTIRMPANQQPTRASIAAALAPVVGARAIPKHTKG